MAKIKAPFLSLGASGQLGKTIVASTWKGIKTLREYVVPANPKTADQVTQRGYMTTALARWKASITAAYMRTGWNLGAQVNPLPMSGANEYMSNAVKLLAATAGAEVTIDYWVYAGDKPRQLSITATTLEVPATEVQCITQVADVMGVATFEAVNLVDGTINGIALDYAGTEQYIRVAAVYDSKSYWVSGVIVNPIAA